jgi:hypothetical protein
VTLEQLEQLRAARLDPRDLPHTTTRREADAYAAETAALDHRAETAKAAMATLATLATDDADAEWLDRLNVWRKTLCDELLALPSRIRDARTLGVQKNVTLSIRAIDFGGGQFRNSGWELESSRLGALMIADGYEVVGADPAQNYGGRLPCHGSIKEVEHRMKDAARRRARAQAQLDSALMDDDERAKQEAEAKELREALNSLRVRHGADGRSLLVVDRDNEPIDETTLTPVERRALERARQALGEAVTS